MRAENSFFFTTMSEISPEERKRLLRERRQAKMKAGNASERLNTILSQGSSVKTAPVVSTLDKPKDAPPSHDDDPEIQDLDTITGQSAAPEPNFDDMLSQIFGANPGAANAGPNTDSATDPFAQMMNMFQQQQGQTPADSPAQDPSSPEEIYRRQLRDFNVYQQKVWKFRFLVIRYAAVLANFWYHFVTFNNTGFKAASYSYVRGLLTESHSSFISIFFAVELVVLSSYYIIGTQKHLFQASGENSLIIKGMSMGSLVLPQLLQYQPLVIKVLGYWDLLNMLLGDVYLVVFLFGITSF